MKNILRRKTVNESSGYDDLLSKSPKTRQVLKNPESSQKKKDSKSKLRKKTSARVLKVHLRDKKGAASFASRIKQRLHSDHRNITFVGTYDAISKIGAAVSDVPRASCKFTDVRSSTSLRKNKRKIWHTDDFYNRHWIDMPPFRNEKNDPFITFSLSFSSTKHLIAFAALIKQPISPETKSIWFPYKAPKSYTNKTWIGNSKTNKPRYPVFIISKGRAQYGPLTAKALREIGVPFYLMVEPHEYDKYRVLCDWAEDIFVIPESNHGQGPGRARNACWDVAKKHLKSKRHWCLDDNIRGFYRLHENERIRVGDGTIFRAAEDFVDRYKNVPVAGFAYRFFHPEDSKQYPFLGNTRIYSCLLIDNDCPYRWRGRYNEDTILSLDVMKDGHQTHHDLNKRKADGSFKTPKRERLATIEFVSFLQEKLATQTMKGGNTAEFYDKEGTAAKSLMLVETHPDVAKAVMKFNREHHDVDYKVFRTNWLIRTDKRKKELKKRSWRPANNKNPYGMRLIEVQKSATVENRL